MLLIPWRLLFLSTVIAAATALKPPTTLITAVNTTMHNCQRKCGNVTIPFPFGIGPNCSFTNWYSVICNTSYKPPRAFSMVSLGYTARSEILNISATQITIQNSRSQIASRCQDSQGKVTSQTVAHFDITNSPFTYSDTSNKLTVTGCNEFALISEASGTLQFTTMVNYSQFRAGCLALCSYTSELVPGACSGLGCCQTSIPTGLQAFTVNLSVLSDYFVTVVSSFQRCSYAFLSADGTFNFGGTTDITGVGVPNRTRNQVPIVLDWAITLDAGTRHTCNETKNTSTYACQSNTRCIDIHAGGYRCECLQGYEGNPYLGSGCSDFDECSTWSPCSMICINTPGSFKCSCPRGYVGDGHKFGSGCKPDAAVSSTSQKKVILGLSITLGSIFLFGCGWWLYMVLKRRRLIKQRARYFERNGGLILEQKMSSSEGFVERIKVYTIKELEKATDHFSENRIVGKGGQGTVYKGMLDEGRLVAIKKLKSLDESQSKEFINEIVILSQLNHRNIVKLLGCCLEAEVPVLLYEYVPNGTLFDQIHYPSEEFTITWKMRLEIAMDSAAALAYLHSSSSIPVFHRDIKSSNILLDEKYRAKLSDFGSSRSVDIDQTHITTRVLGTFGYVDPEYFQSSQFTEKGDVYSFGVVLVELLTGEKAIRSIAKEDRSLTSWFLSNMENSQLLNIVDSQVLREASKEELLAVANLAKRCLYLDGKQRPTMRQVLAEIEAVRSPHLLQTKLLNRPDTRQELIKRTRSGYDQSRLSASHAENSAELSLLFNPR